MKHKPGSLEEAAQRVLLGEKYHLQQIDEIKTDVFGKYSHKDLSGIARWIVEIYEDSAKDPKAWKAIDYYFKLRQRPNSHLDPKKTGDVVKSWKDLINKMLPLYKKNDTTGEGQKAFTQGHMATAADQLEKFYQSMEKIANDNFANMS